MMAEKKGGGSWLYIYNNQYRIYIYIIVIIPPACSSSLYLIIRGGYRRRHAGDLMPLTRRAAAFAWPCTIGVYDVPPSADIYTPQMLSAMRLSIGVRRAYFSI